MTDIRTRIEKEVPGLQIETIQLMEDLIGDLTAVPQPVEVKLFSDDPIALNKAAQQVGDAIDIRVRPGALAQQGLDADAFASQIEALVRGTEATKMRAGEQLVSIRVRAPEDLRQRAAQIAQLPLVAPDGHGLTVGQVADVTVQAGQQQLTREDLAPFVAVTGRLEGRDLGSGMQDVRKTSPGCICPAASASTMVASTPSSRRALLTSAWYSHLHCC